MKSMNMDSLSAEPAVSLLEDGVSSVTVPGTRFHVKPIVPRETSCPRCGMDQTHLLQELIDLHHRNCDVSRETKGPKYNCQLCQGSGLVRQGDKLVPCPACS